MTGKYGNAQNASLLEQIAEEFSQAYFIYEVNGKRFQYINIGALQQMLGTELEGVWESSSSLLPFIHPEDEAYAFDQYQKLLQDKQRKSIEFRLILPGQPVKWVCLSACVLQREGECPILIGGYAEDITNAKAYTANILKFNAKKNSTLEILSHDLAAPFANIEGITKIMEQRAKEGDSETQQLISFIKQDAKRGSDMIRDFVNSEFQESSEIVLHKERVDIVAKLAVMLDTYRQRMQQLAKSFEFTAPKKPIFMYLDEMKFMQVMNNLVSNAIKFTRNNGKITVSVEDKGNMALIKVSDDGIGIPEHLQPFLFDKFTKARRPGLRGGKSVGLGMSIIKSIVEWHGGRIWFESIENTGSTFFMEIPKE